MDNFIHRQRPGLPLDDTDDIFQRRAREYVSRSILNLHDEYRTDNLLFLGPFCVVRVIRG